VDARKEDRTGELVGKRYRLDQLVDRGGQGSVYRATDTRQGDVVAVKILLDSHSEGADWRERMLREAHAMVVLAGTAAVRAVDQQMTEDGLLCLVMEWLDG